MIAQSSVPTVKEYMIGYTVGSFPANASTMRVYIPMLMSDKKASDKGTSISIPANFLVSKENIAVASSVMNNNFIEVSVSDLFKKHHRELSYAWESNIQYRFDTIANNTKVKIYAPDLDIDQALIVPLV